MATTDPRLAARIREETSYLGPDEHATRAAVERMVREDFAVDPEHDSGCDCFCPACADKPRCRYCGSDYEGCECTERDALGRDAGRY